ncbi:helix-turn-helix domain-containing protein [Leptobacterium flavescens]|uniref:Helix-turn-helix domain-containing protein n=1 Tax=Leptobacterium flavescens TaxID=472055 RepID=A0A6P0UHX5_9FLAO|nr:LexA family transcriptional regulator [Leptobacterium flavescens]NER12885.1 helix-turn-helix domain-containing protein [Leptobacterium flavescens]
MDKVLSTEAKRFKQVREEQGYTQQAFADLLGINASTADIERGRTKLSGRVVADLLRHFNVNPLWLYGESSHQYIKTVRADISPKVISVNSAENENILLVNAKASAGYAHNIQDTEWYEDLPAFDLPLPEYRNATYRGFQVEGDSMLPNLQPKEWVIARAVEDMSHIKNNDIYVVVLEDSILVKRVVRDKAGENLQLISINPEYPPIEVASEQVWELWKVHSKIGTDLEIASPDLQKLQQQIRDGFSDLKDQIGKIRN